MCGRYTLTMEPESLYGAFDAEPDPDAGGAEGLYGGDPVRPRYNIAPTQQGGWLERWPPQVDEKAPSLQR